MARGHFGARILLAIGAGTVAAAACGSEEGSSGKALDASLAEGGDDAPSADGAGDAVSEVAPGDATARDAQDATSADGDGQACTPVPGACTVPGDCCPPATCIGSHCYVSVRRPFLVGSSLRLADAVERTDWGMDSAATPAVALDPRTAAALARDWLHDACEEHASIAAFARFTMHLVAVGAPPEMIAESQRAAVDEIQHARACFALARRYGGRAMGPGELSLDGAMTPSTLPEIAALTAEEGCVGETLGVLLAERQLAMTTDPLVRSLLVQANIVTDEARHAELAWRFVAWAVARGGEPVRRAVADAIRRAVAETLATPIRSYPGVDVAAWRAHGRLTCADARAVAAQGIREIIEPCAAALLGDPRPNTRDVTDDRTCSA